MAFWHHLNTLITFKEALPNMLAVWDRYHRYNLVLGLVYGNTTIKCISQDNTAWSDQWRAARCAGKSIQPASTNPFSRPSGFFLVSRPLLNVTRHKSALLQTSWAIVGLQNFCRRVRLHTKYTTWLYDTVHGIKLCKVMHHTVVGQLILNESYAAFLKGSFPLGRNSPHLLLLSLRPSYSLY